MAVDEGKLNDLLGRFVTDLGGSYQAVSAVIGDRLGLYRALLSVMPATPTEVAAAAGVGERYAREWLRGQAAGGYITYDSDAQRFLLTEEQAFALASPDGMQIAAAFHLPVAVSKNAERITKAFRTNGAFGWHEHDRRVGRRRGIRVCEPFSGDPPPNRACDLSPHPALQCSIPQIVPRR
jgi:hypothetical protein